MYVVTGNQEMPLVFRIENAMMDCIVRIFDVIWFRLAIVEAIKIVYLPHIVVRMVYAYWTVCGMQQPISVLRMIYVVVN